MAIHKNYKLELTKEAQDSKTYACTNKKDVCCGLGVDPKHWNGYNHLCCNTDKKCNYKMLMKNETL